MSLWWNYAMIVILLVGIGGQIAIIRLKIRKRDFVCAGVQCAQPPAPGVIPGNSIFHKPSGASCPAGTELVPAYFRQKDGSTKDACYNPHGDGTTDYLNPGEGFTFQFFITPSDEAPTEGKA